MEEVMTHFEPQKRYRISIRIEGGKVVIQDTSYAIKK